jgi:hypothetical protein
MAWQAVAELKGETGSFSFTGPSGSVLFYDGSSVTGSTYFSYDPAGLGKLTVAGTIDPIYMTLTTSSTGTTGYSPESTLWYGPTGGGTGLGALYVGNVPLGVGSNFIKVDSVWGNDTLAATNKYQIPFKTVSAGVSGATSGDTVFVYPGTYNEPSMTLPTGICLRGANVQTVNIQQLGVTGDTTFITMGESTRIEDLTLKMTSSEHHTLKGIYFGGQTSVTAKIRTAVLTVDNSTAGYTGASNVYGVEFGGTGTLGAGSFSFNSLKGSTINVFSDGAGIKRGILVSGTNVSSTRDMNVYVAAPTNPTGATGSYVGVETNDGESGAIQLRSTTIGTVRPGTTGTYTASDILQSTPATIENPTYLASPGIQLGPGTDLVTKSAGGRGFSTYIYPTTIYYGLKGELNVGVNGYLWPGTQAANNSGNNVFPDPTTPAAFYRVQQPFILSGMNVSLGLGPSGTTGTYTTTFTVRRTAFGGTGPVDVPNYTLSFTDGELNKSYYSRSQDFEAGDLIHVYVEYTGGNSNKTTDITVQLDCF